MPNWFRNKVPSTAQLELPLARTKEPDRNHRWGGRSFYFFDFDDNVAFLTTPMFLFHRQTKKEIEISSRDFAKNSATIGKSGEYADYSVDLDPVTGSFRCFRDKDINWLQRLLGRRQIFVEDLGATLGLPDVNWKGPSWNCFYHAVFNSRPIALITARGHHPETIKKGIQLWVKEGHLPDEPNYLAIYPVSHPETKKSLRLQESDSIPLLKQKALRASVYKALELYGMEVPHRFGMSDDDPRNVKWILDEMRELKRELPRMSFFVIQAHGDQAIKREVYADRVEEKIVRPEVQMSFFEE